MSIAAGNRLSDMVFGETAVGRGGLTASKLRVTRGLPRGPSRLRISRELRLLGLKPAARLPTAADRAGAARMFARPTEGSRWSIPVLAVCGEQVDPSAMAEASCVEGTKPRSVDELAGHRVS